MNENTRNKKRWKGVIKKCKIKWFGKNEKEYKRDEIFKLK